MYAVSPHDENKPQSASFGSDFFCRKRVISDIWLSAEASLVLALSSPVYLKTPRWAVALNDSQLSYRQYVRDQAKSTSPTVRLALLTV